MFSHILVRQYNSSLPFVKSFRIAYCLHLHAIFGWLLNCRPGSHTAVVMTKLHTLRLSMVVSRLARIDFSLNNKRAQES